MIFTIYYDNMNLQETNSNSKKIMKLKCGLIFMKIFMRPFIFHIKKKYLKILKPVFSVILARCLRFVLCTLCTLQICFYIFYISLEYIIMDFMHEIS